MKAVPMATIEEGREIKGKSVAVRRRIRTGVIGVSASGKTTLLVSLMDRLLRQDGKLSGMNRVRATHIGPFGGPDEFPLDAYRKRLCNQRVWPRKTKSGSKTAVRIELESNPGAGVLGRFVGEAVARGVAFELEFVDIPGERMSDFIMAGRGFADWSDVFLAALRENELAGEMSDGFETLLDAGGVSEARAILEWKRVLARLTRARLPLVSPSTFLVDHDQTYPVKSRPAPWDISEADLIARGIIGLSRSQEFTPLSAAARAANPALAELFTERYAAYAQEIGRLWNEFRQCENLLVAVNVHNILENGPGAFFAAHDLIEHVLRFVNPGLSTGGRIVSALEKLFLDSRPKVDRVGFIATCADCVHSDDLLRLERLLRSLVDEMVRPYSVNGRTTFECFCVAAVHAVRSRPGNKRLVEYWAREGQTFELREAPVSEVPVAGWPPTTRWGEYVFATDVAPPPLDYTGDAPFPSINVDKVQGFVFRVI